MTETSGRQAISARRHPFEDLRPLAVVPTGHYGVSIPLATPSISRTQRAAALTYLAGGVAGTFTLAESAGSDPFTIRGTTSHSVNRDSLDKLRRLVSPSYDLSGTLSLEVVRHDRRMIGVLCAITLGADEPREVKFDAPRNKPPQVHEVIVGSGGNQIRFSLNHPDRRDSDLIDDAMAAAEVFGVYITHRPAEVIDHDPDAELFPNQFDYLETGADNRE